MKKYDDIITRLYNSIPTTSCELNFKSNYELLVAVVLSAQCTDKRVNEVTKELFAHASTPQQMVEFGREKLQEIIFPCGLSYSKSKNIIDASKDIIEKFGGNVPSDFKDLTSLSGVGEKSASVIQAVGFKIPAIAVDTHVFRVSNRIGIAKTTSVHQTMEELKKKISKPLWIDAHLTLVMHGRYCCTARNPKCEECCINGDCKYYKRKRCKNV